MQNGVGFTKEEWFAHPENIEGVPADLAASVTGAATEHVKDMARLVMVSIWISRGEHLD